MNHWDQKNDLDLNHQNYNASHQEQDGNRLTTPRQTFTINVGRPHQHNRDSTYRDQAYETSEGTRRKSSPYREAVRKFAMQNCKIEDPHCH